MFNRRDSESQTASTDRRQVSGTATSSKSGAAFIGPTIKIEGSIVAVEDLLIEGEIHGRVEIKSNKLTIGEEGRVFADVHAKQVSVKGRMDGHLVVKEQLEIQATAQIEGTITSPRISLQDGARFTGSIDMDPEAKAIKEVFGPTDSTASSQAKASSKTDKHKKEVGRSE